MAKFDFPTFTLNDGNEIPVIGMGTMQIPDDGSTYQIVSKALSIGYRHIDTAPAYFNEDEVGQAVEDSRLKRDQIFITSKLWLQDYSYEDAKKAIDLSLNKLRTDYIDLFLLHWPYGKVTEAWQAMEEAQKAGKIKSIGVSNMTPKLWKQYVPYFHVKPAVNQVEFNPYFQRKSLHQLMNKENVQLEAWGPLSHGDSRLFNEPLIQQLAKKYHKNVGQIILRFENQEGVVILPKSVHPDRLKSNLDIFDFKLSPKEIEQLEQLDTGKGTYDPDAPGMADRMMNVLDIHRND